MPEKRTPEEIVEIAKQIRRRVRDRVEAAMEGAAQEAKLDAALDAVSRAMDEVGDELDKASRHIDAFIRQTESRQAEARQTEAQPSERTHAREEAEEPEEPQAPGESIRPAPAPRTVNAREDFWDLGRPKPRIYAEAKFSSGSLSPADVNAPDPEPEPGERVVRAEKSVRGGEAREERIPANPYQGSSGRVVNTAGGQRSVPQGVYATRSYRRGSSQSRNPRPADLTPAKKSPAAPVVKTYTPEGTLIREITVRTWEADTEFYNRFLTDALRSHNTKFLGDIHETRPPVPYYSYVPQYAHMSLAQVNYYEYVRECARNGIFPPCDFPYVLLYIFEILNLPDAVPPEEGAPLLASVWLGWRGQYPRLDGYLCEWLPDYCMIHGVPLPDSLAPILPEIVPKAQFKEFYLNRASGGMLTKTVIETSSDYDYRTSRYYAENRDAYERHIPAAVSAALAEQAAEHRGIFALDRVYKMTRDSFCGAIAASSVKRRLDIEFVSFTRRADTRTAVTALVKHAENRLRALLGVKAKLGERDLGEEDSRAIDAYFAPMLPTKEQIRQKKEDAYMPADYLKNYEAEDTGFDPGAAAAIEAQSWANAARLTGEDYGTPPAEEPEEIPVIEGEMTADETIPAEAIPPKEERIETEESKEEKPENAGETDAEGSDTPEDASGDEELLKAGLRAAMAGGFRAFCRSRSLYEGDLADRINARFLDLVGDVALEASPDGGFEFIEEYREDAQEWLR